MNKEKILTEENIIETAKLLNVEPACIKAVLSVETKGRGFLSNDDPVILFEGHIFWDQLQKRNIDPKKYLKKNKDILYQKWTKEFYLGGIKEYSRLLRAKLIHEEAALCSASWGLFQIMGFNCRLCGCSDVKSFVKAMYISEFEQLKIFAAYMKSTGMHMKLQDKDWAGFAKLYNGPGYAQNQYNIKLKDAYNKLSETAEVV